MSPTPFRSQLKGHLLWGASQAPHPFHLLFCQFHLYVFSSLPLEFLVLCCLPLDSKGPIRISHLNRQGLARSLAGTQ